MKKMLLWVLPAIAILCLGIVAWRYLSRPSPGGADRERDGYTLLCRHCDHTFFIAREQIDSYPADPNGAGFKCEKCAKFGASVATQCKKCRKWFIAGGRGTPCPHCSSGQAGSNGA